MIREVVHPDDLGDPSSPVREHDCELVGAADHMVVGDDVSVGRIHDTASATLTQALLVSTAMMLGSLSMPPRWRSHSAMTSEAVVGGGTVRIGGGGLVGTGGSSNTPVKPRIARVTPVPRRAPPTTPRTTVHMSGRPGSGPQGVAAVAAAAGSPRSRQALHRAPSQSCGPGGPMSAHRLGILWTPPVNRSGCRWDADADRRRPLVEEVARPDSGATVLFLGTVRDHSSPSRVSPTSNTRSTPSWWSQKSARSWRMAADRWPILGAVVEHRSGTVSLGEASWRWPFLAPTAMTPSTAARFIIDELKTRAPIWKKEHWPGRVGVERRLVAGPRPETH